MPYPLTKKRPIVMGRFCLVAEAGIEPALPKEQDFESSASTSSATQPNFCTLVGWGFTANACDYSK